MRPRRESTSISSEHAARTASLITEDQTGGGEGCGVGERREGGGWHDARLCHPASDRSVCLVAGKCTPTGGQEKPLGRSAGLPTGRP